MGGLHLIDEPPPAPPWRRLVGPACSLSVLVVVCTLAAWALLAPVVTGLRPVVITSGSMHPSLDVGDVVLLDTGAEATRGRIATFVRPDRTDGALVTHRLAGRDRDAWLTRGDANAGPDPWRVGDRDIVGIGRLVVPIVGLPATWATQGRVDLLAGAGVVLGVLIWSAMSVRRPRGGRHLRRTVAQRIARLGRLLLHAAVLVALVGAAADQRPVAASFTADTANAGSSVAAATLPAPAGLTATPGCTLLVIGPKVDLSWDAVGGATGYEVQRSAGAGFSLLTTLTGSSTTYADTSVLGLSTYTYRVRALQGAWSSTVSAGASATTGVCL